jgi:hypothetical protein
MAAARLQHPVGDLFLISGIVVTDEGTKKLCKDVNDRNVETFKARWSSVLTSRGIPGGESGIAETGLSGVLDLGGVGDEVRRRGPSHLLPLAARR